MAAMNCLILGGAGFLGSHVVYALLERGHKVRIFDRPRVKTKNLSSSMSHIEFKNGDFTNESDIAKALEDIDTVVHLAMKHRATPSKQLSFASHEFAQKKRVARREKFLAEMQRVVPWARLLALIEPKHPTGGRVGRQPIGVSGMLRMYFLQQWFGLADEALEDAIYDGQSMRDFLGIDLARESVLDATTLLKFRRLLEEHQLAARLFEGINAHLAEGGLLLRKGTMVDATIIAAPPSTKNKEHARDPEMHQTKKGNEWHFGMKAHIGADADSGLVHSLHATAANESDVAHKKRAEIVQTQAQGKGRSGIQWSMA